MELKLSRDDEEAVKNFQLQAQQFCKFIDACGCLNQSKLIRELCVRVARICEAGARLPPAIPATGNGNDFTAESVRDRSEQCVARSLSLGRQLGELDRYWDVFDPSEKEEPILCLLSRDLAEIYMDLQGVVKLGASGADRADIYWQWRFDFLSHWSRHAASALKALLALSNRV